MSSFVVMKNPGFQKPITATTATMIARSTPITALRTASERLDDPESAPGGAYSPGSPNCPVGCCPNWVGCCPNWVGCCPNWVGCCPNAGSLGGYCPSGEYCGAVPYCVGCDPGCSPVDGYCWYCGISENVCGSGGGKVCA